MIKETSLKIWSVTFLSSFLVSFINSLCNSNGDFFRLVSVFDGPGLFSSSAAFLLASRIIEP